MEIHEMVNSDGSNSHIAKALEKGIYMHVLFDKILFLFLNRFNYSWAESAELYRIYIYI